MEDECHFFKMKKAADAVCLSDWAQYIKFGLSCTDLTDFLGMYGGGYKLELKLGLYKL
jgi:hypothetical protein